MKKIFTLSLMSGAAALLFMANQGGASTNGPGDRTGRASSTTTCRSCHTGSTYGNVTVTQIVRNANGDVVTQYVGGQTYTVQLTTNTTAGTPAGYSFQWVAVNATDNSTNLGVPTTTQANSVVHTFQSRKYVEQSARMSTNTVTFQWLAPAAGSGSVRMVYVGMAVNGNNNDGGTDTCSPSASTTLTEQTVSSERLDMPVSSLKVFPNPVADVLNLRISTVQSGNYVVIINDLTGKTLATQTISLVQGDQTVTLPTQDLVAGVYAVRLMHESRLAASTTIVKQ